jgi:hypothetical protein
MTLRKTDCKISLIFIYKKVKAELKMLIIEKKINSVRTMKFNSAAELNRV